MPQNNPNLLPCPFCGETRIYLTEGRDGCINCPSCLAAVPNEQNNTKELIAQWNSRANFDAELMDEYQSLMDHADTLLAALKKIAEPVLIYGDAMSKIERYQDLSKQFKERVEIAQNALHPTKG